MKTLMIIVSLIFGVAQAKNVSVLDFGSDKSHREYTDLSESEIRILKLNLNSDALLIKKVSKTKKTFSMLEPSGRENLISAHGRSKIDTAELGVWSAAEILANSQMKDGSNATGFLAGASLVVGIVVLLLCIAANSMFGVVALFMIVFGLAGTIAGPAGKSKANTKEKFLESVTVPLADLNNARNSIMQNDEVIIICGSKKKMRLKCDTYENFAKTLVEQIAEK